MRWLPVYMLLGLLSCQEIRKHEPQNNYLSAIAHNDIGLAEPQPGEWLYEHEEAGQNFKAYKRKRPIRITNKRNKIYLLPLGTFNKEEKRLIQSCKEYLHIFYQNTVEVLPAIGDNIIPFHARRDREDPEYGEQLNAKYILDSVLKTRVPHDGVILMALTSKDIYPKPEWNFVFGLAYYKKRIGVTSMKRYYDTPRNHKNYTQCLKRLISVSSHEIGHMFGMAHCTYAHCVMNGANSMQETDATPNRLCSQCQEKLSWNLKYNPKKRLSGKLTFFKINDLTIDHQIALKDSISLTNNL